MCCRRLRELRQVETRLGPDPRAAVELYAALCTPELQDNPLEALIRGDDIRARTDHGERYPLPPREPVEPFGALDVIGANQELRRAADSIGRVIAEGLLLKDRSPYIGPDLIQDGFVHEATVRTTEGQVKPLVGAVPYLISL